MASKAPKTKTVKQVEADMAAKAAADKKAAKRSSGGRPPGSNAPAKKTPDVLSGMVTTETIDPNAERALKNEKVAADYNEAKRLYQSLMEVEKSRLEVLQSIAEKLMDLRAHFKEPGSRGRRIDWNGESLAYRALASLLLRDLGLDGPDHNSTKRSIRYQIENVKRERVPQKDWEHFGISALTRGQRQALTAKFGKAHDGVEETAKETAERASTGQVTGAQLVTLAKRIDAGISVYSMASLRTLTPAQRTTFREQLEDTRQKTEAILQELDELD